MTRALLLLALSIGVEAYAQAPRPPGARGAPPTLRVSGAPSGPPVTRTEVRAVLAKARKAMASALGRPLGTAPLSPGGGAVATRAQVVAGFWSLYQALEPSFTYTPVSVSFDSGALRMGGAERARLERLIREGFVAKLGPLATGPGANLSVAEFGDAVGYFLARAAQLTHLPSPKWSPGLGAGG